MTASHEFSDAEFLATFLSPMRDVTGSCGELVDLWGYLDPLLNLRYPAAEKNGWEWRVAFIRQSADGPFQHIAVPVPRDNTYMVVVVDVPSRAILGHHLLDLGEKYGLAASAT